MMCCKVPGFWNDSRCRAWRKVSELSTLEDRVSPAVTPEALHIRIHISPPETPFRNPQSVRAAARFLHRPAYDKLYSCTILYICFFSLALSSFAYSCDASAWFLPPPFPPDTPATRALLSEVPYFDSLYNARSVKHEACQGTQSFSSR